MGTAIDYDNDGWMDFAAVGETPQGKGEIRMFHNLGARGFVETSSELGLKAVALNSPRALESG